MSIFLCDIIEINYHAIERTNVMSATFNILYYSWGEITSSDFMQTINKLGHRITLFSCPLTGKLNDALFEEKLTKKIKENAFDFIFTFNYFPVISKVATNNDIKYISWVYDNPHLTLRTKSVFNPCNHIFLFDRAEALYLRSIGVPHAYHMPLAVNADKYKQLNTNHSSYDYDICFLGSLYNDEYNFYDQIKNIPDYYKGFFDCLIKSQMNIFGYDLVSQVITDEYEEAIRSFATFNFTDEFFLSDTEMFISILQKKITNTERIRTLKLLSEVGFDVTHFGPTSDASLDKVHFKGYINYDTQMPQIFNRSKINLNITLRSITSGIPLRCLDIMAGGGFLLSNYQPELAEYFENGKEVIMYESMEDLAEKAEYYLIHDDERKEIARNGQLKTLEHFSYEKQLNKIFEIVMKG